MGNEGREERKIDASRWNGHEAFEKFLKKAADGDKKRVQLALKDEEHNDDDVFSNADINVVRPPPAYISSPNSHTYRAVSQQSTHPPSSLPHPYPYPHPTETPLPSTKLHRLRVQYASRRLERLNKKGLGELGVEVGFVDDEGDELSEDGDGDRAGEEAEVC